MTAPSARRLAAVCFADIVGYTTLASKDEDAALRLVQHFQELVRRRLDSSGGRVTKFMGDGVLLEFTSADSALRAVIALQVEFTTTAGELGFATSLRVGIHVGEVTVAADGDLYGDGINIASRLHGEAQPGQVVVSADVMRLLQARPDFQMQSLGMRSIKGIVRPIEIYAAGDVSQNPHRVSFLPQGRARSFLLRLFPGSKRRSARVASTKLRRTTVRSLVGLGALVGAAATIKYTAVLEADISFNEDDWLIVADCENQTRDSLFDGTLENALRVSLRESGRLNVFTREQAEDARARLATTPDGPLDVETASAVARRQGASVVLGCGIQRIAGGYVLTASIIDPIDRSVIRSVKHETMRQDSLLYVLDELGNRVRRALGESRAELRRQNETLRSTTASLPALKNFIEGMNSWRAGRFDEARHLWELAIREDSTYAAAYARLGSYHSWMGNRARAEEQNVRALEFAEQVTERERLWIHSLVAANRGNRQASINTLNIYLRRYPRDRDGWYSLGTSYMRTDDCDNAIPALQRALQIDSAMVNAHINTASCYKGEGKLGDALRHYQEALARAPHLFDSGNLNHELGFTYAAVGEYARADSLFRRRINAAPGAKAGALRSLALLAMYRGRYNAALEPLQEAIRLTQGAQLMASEFRNRAFLAAAYAHLGDTDRQRLELNHLWTLRGKTNLEPFFFAVFGQLLIAAGDIDRAERLVEDAIRTSIPDNEHDAAALNVLKGEIQLARGNVMDAVSLLELAHSSRADDFTLEPLARAYRLAELFDRATTAYERIRSRHGIGWEGQDAYLAAPYWLGRMAEQQGDHGTAIEHLQAYIDQFESADTDLPLMLDAKLRLSHIRATLQATRG